MADAASWTLRAGVARPADLVGAGALHGFGYREREHCAAWPGRPDRWLGRLAARRAVGALWGCGPWDSRIEVTGGHRSRPTLAAAPADRDRPAPVLTITHCARLGLALAAAPGSRRPGDIPPFPGIDIVHLDRPMLSDPLLRPRARRRVVRPDDAMPPGEDPAGVGLAIAAKEAAVKAMSGTGQSTWSWLDVRLRHEGGPAPAARLAMEPALAGLAAAPVWQGRAEVPTARGTRRCGLVGFVLPADDAVGVVALADRREAR